LPLRWVCSSRTNEQAHMNVASARTKIDIRLEFEHGRVLLHGRSTSRYRTMLIGYSASLSRSGRTHINTFPVLYFRAVGATLNLQLLDELLSYYIPCLLMQQFQGTTSHALRITEPTQQFQGTTSHHRGQERGTTKMAIIRTSKICRWC
jgi:hypothetical protein